MKLFNPRAITKLLCLGLCSLGALNANDDVGQPVKQTEEREPLTAKEENTIQEERFSHLPKELLQYNGFYYGTENFRDYDYLQLVHPNSDHYVVGCSDEGDVIQLNDESEWSIGLFSRGTVRGWKSDDVLYIKPKCSWFSYYNYVIQNRTVSESADANLLSVPLFPVANSLEIIAIDVANKVVQLSDDTLWQINPTDYAFRKWKVGDRLIVGVNSYWRMGTFVHILINTTYHNKPYCEANFVGYPYGS